MNENFAIQLFEGKKVRIVWDAEQEKYYFSVADIVQVLTDSADVKQYIKRMRARDSELNSKWGTICTPVEISARPFPFGVGSLRIYSRILRGICATAGVFSSSLTALGLNGPIGRFYASINAPYAHLIHKISFYWTKKHPNVCICAIFVVIL